MLLPLVLSRTSVDRIGPLTTRTADLSSFWRTLIRAVIANIEMSGVLFDGLTRWRVFVLLNVLAGFVASYVIHPQLTTSAALGIAVVLFVARQSFLLLSFTPRGVAYWLKRWYGVRRGAEAYEGLTALFFYYRSYSFSLMVQKTAFLNLSGLEPYRPYLEGLGCVLIGIGLLVNTWSFLCIGRPAYYYLDMFYGDFLQPFTNQGPYQFLKNPMYSLGQLPSYGLSLVYGSYWGLLFSVANQVCCYVFYRVAELPHIQAVLSRRAEIGVSA